MESARSMPSGCKFQAVRFYVGLLLVPAALFCLALNAQAQTFSLTIPGGFASNAVNPGGTDTASLVINPLNGGVNGTVALSCAITPAPPNGNQGCTVSPQTVTPPTGASISVDTAYTGTTSGTWPPGAYTVTITGTAGAETETASASFAVLNVTGAFNILVPQPIAPASVPAGNSAQGTIEISPINGYSGMVTLSCATVTPLVLSPPVCNFNPTTVNVAGAPVPATITITTTGPLQVTSAPRSRILYALWLPLPMLALAGIGAAAGGRRIARASSTIALLMLVACILFLPACQNATNTGTPSIGTGTVTPNNTYTFTITGVDQNGTAATTTTGSTVKLTVTTANPT